MSLCHENLSNMMMTNYAMLHHHKYSLAEIENLMPWEKDIYVSLLMTHVQEEKQRRETQKQQQG